MKEKLSFYCFLFAVLMFFQSQELYSQATNPAPQSLPFLQDFSALAHSSTTYPAGIQGWTISTAPGSSFNTNAATADRTLTASSTANTTSGNVHNYNGKIGYLNSSSLDLTIVIAVNTTGKENIDVNYDIMTIRNPYDGGSNTRINEVTLQYRIGTSGSFTNLTGVEYQNNTITQTTAITTPQNLQAKTITLPADCNNQPVVQIRWASRQVSGGGSRPSFAFDNIVIDGDDISGPSPTLFVTPVTLSGFEYFFSQGPSASQSFNVSGTDLSGDVSVSAPLSYEVSTTSGGTYAGSINLTPSSGSVNQDIYVRLKSNLSVGTYNNEVITISSAGAISKTVTCNGTVMELVPTLYVSPATLSGFTYVINNGPSTEKQISISGVNLTDNIVLTPPSNYEISTGTGALFSAQNPLTLTQNAGSVQTTTIYVRLAAGLPLGSYNNEVISITSAGAASKTVTCSGNVTNPLPAAIVLLRPAYIDISSSTSESAVLMKLENYPSDDARYKLYRETFQYNCWDETTDAYITSISYADNPSVPGTPSSSTTFWIMSQRGTNISTIASYRDRLSPYSANYQTTALPSATEITSSYTLSGTFAGTPQFGNSVKRVVLAYSGSTLVSAASTALNTGTFAVVCPDGITIDKIEFRAVDNTLIDQITGIWNDDANVTTNPIITVSLVSLTGFSYYEGSGPSQELTFSLSGVNLTDNITVTPPSNYQVSKTSGSGFISFPNVLTFSPNGGTVADSTVYVRLKAGLPTGDYNNEVINISSTGATMKSINCSGSVLPALPVINITPSALTGFTYVINNGPSAEQSFVISGDNLNSDISILPSANYEISSGSGAFFVAQNPLILNHIGGTVASATVYVRLKQGLSVGSYNNELIIASATGSADKTVTCSGSVTDPLPAATILKRPQYIDLGTATSQGAVLMKLEHYPADSVKYRLFNGSNQYHCWNPATNQYVTSTSYANGPLVPGTPSTSTSFWIMFQRGTNNSTVASYRDRLAPYTGTEFLTTSLPSATAITGSFTLTGTFVGLGIYDNTQKHVVLAYSGTSLISAASTTLNTGIFAVVCPDGVTINKIEIRTFDDILIQEFSGSWSDDEDITTTPTITTTVSVLNGFTYYEGAGPSAEQFFYVNGNYLTDDIIITPSDNYEISLTSGTGYVSNSTFLTIPQFGGSVFTVPVYVRLKSGLPVGDYNAEVLTLTTLGGISKIVTCSGNVLPAVPTISVNPTVLTGFNYLITNGGPSAEKSFEVSGVFLTSPISITPPLNYEISTGSGVSFVAQNPIVINHTGGVITTTTVYVRLKAGLSLGSYLNELITLSSTGATDKSVACSGSVTDPVPAAIVLSRPAYVDISAATSEGAVLMRLENYTSDSARYRLYNGSFQYNCWWEDSTKYITSFSFSDAPFAPGTPTTSTAFWILYQRGGNNSTAASYRDRIGPLYSVTHLTTALPAATAINTPFTLTGTFTGTGIYDNSVKHVVLAYSGSTLISAASTTLNTGIFTLVCPVGVNIDKIEVRAVDNTLIDYITGSWSDNANVGDIPFIPTTKTLNLTLYLEGLYSGNGMMNQARGLTGPQYEAGIADKITVELYAPTTPPTLSYSNTNISLNTNGTAVIDDIPSTLGEEYYIVIKHRNSIETWSGLPVLFEDSNINYNFATMASQAYGNNLKLFNGYYLIYCGDITQDGIIDGVDMSLVENASNLFLMGYNSEDVNGDNIVDGLDMSIVENNANVFIQVKKP